MKQKKVNYADVIIRGFKRKELSDNVFFNQNGYGWFLVTKKLSKKISLDWDCETHFLTLIREGKQGTIHGRIYLTGELEELDRIIRFFTEDTPDTLFDEKD